MELKAPIIAAIDVGTNSFHMVVTSVNQKGIMRPITRDKQMVRLGSGSRDMKYIAEDAIVRGVETLKQFAKIAEGSNAFIRAVATSAVREAINKNDFIERVKSECGIEIEVVSGAEEGRLIYIGTIHALPIYNLQTLVIDIGGGSTETIIGFKGEIEYVHSEKIGAIRLTNKFFPDYITSKQSIKKCREFLKGEWSPILRLINKIGFKKVVGSSGTIQTLAYMTLARKKDIVPEILNGITLDAQDLLETIEILIATDTPNKRASLAGMDPKRADIIIGGALILETAIKELNIKNILISPYALREGIVFDTLQKIKNINEYRHLSHLRHETIYNICNQYNIEMKHSENVKNNSLQIFDDLAQIHKLKSKERELLESAALLHDIGYFISHDQHHKHSYYIITHCDMPGFTNDEAEIIANIARYHRKSHPKKKHDNYSSLTAEKKYIISVLSGILRIAEGLDRRQQQYVKYVYTTMKNNTLNVFLVPSGVNGIADIELWGAERRKNLLQDTLNINIIFHIDKETAVYA